MRRVLAVAVLLSLATFGVPADDEGTVLVRLESKDETVREAAEDEWDALDAAKQVALARKALDDPESAGAWAAAKRVSAFCLDLDEQARQAKALLSRGPLEELDACFGAADLMSIGWVASRDAELMDDAHRIATADAVFDFAEMDDGDQLPSSRMAAIIRNVAWHTDDRREAFAAYFAAKRELKPARERRGAAPEGSGLPTDFRILAAAAWGLESEIDAKKLLSRIVPWAWVLRWAANLIPTAADLSFLDEVIATTDDVEARGWALRHRVRLAGNDAIPWLRRQLGDDGPDCELEIAAHLAILGDRTEWDARAKADPAGAATCPLLWKFDRDAACAGAAKARADLGVQARRRLEMIWGVSITWDDLRSVQRRQLDRVAGLVARGEKEELARELGAALEWIVASHPAGLLRDECGEVITALHRLGSGVLELGHRTLRSTLAILEVRDAGTLLGLLTYWSINEPDLRPLAVPVLVEHSMPVELDVAWDVWTAGGASATWIAEHRGPRVSERLRARLRAAGDRGGPALAALLRLEGYLDARSADALVGVEELELTSKRMASNFDANSLDAHLERAFRKTEQRSLVYALSEEGLRRWRIERSNGTYWTATRALAERGNHDARAELARALTDNRTLLLEPVLNADADPRIGRVLAREHAERLAHNCCSRFQSVHVLRCAFPTMPIEDEWTLATQREIALEWLDRYEKRLIFSRVANGWIPR